MADWITTEIEVRIGETHDDPSLIHQLGIIRSVSVFNFNNIDYFSFKTSILNDNIVSFVSNQ